MTGICTTCFGAGCTRCATTPRRTRPGWKPPAPTFPRCTAMARSGAPCGSLAGPDGRCPQHPGTHPAHGQPLLEDRTIDVRTLVARWDDEYNAKAGAMRP